MLLRPQSYLKMISRTIKSFVYHLICYRLYILKGERRKSIEADQESKNGHETVEAPPQKRQKRNSLGNSTVKMCNM